LGAKSAHQKVVLEESLAPKTGGPGIGRIDVQSTSEKFATDSLELKISISMFLGNKRSRQQADFFWPSRNIISALPSQLSQIALNRQQPSLMVNSAMINSARKLSVALVTSFVIFVGVSQSLATPRTHLEDIQVGQYLKQARDRKPRAVLLVLVHSGLGIYRIEQAPFSTINFHGPVP
jgi:hypothetical protein